MTLKSKLGASAIMLCVVTSPAMAQSVAEPDDPTQTATAATTTTPAQRCKMTIVDGKFVFELVQLAEVEVEDGKARIAVKAGGCSTADVVDLLKG